MVNEPAIDTKSVSIDFCVCKGDKRDFRRDGVPGACRHKVAPLFEEIVGEHTDVDLRVEGQLLGCGDLRLPGKAQLSDDAFVVEVARYALDDVRAKGNQASLRAGASDETEEGLTHVVVDLGTELEEDPEIVGVVESAFDCDACLARWSLGSGKGCRQR